ncbi:SCO family protein [Gaetbulibacter aestuarii]|uniref:SCO family protein n=1 Tax=Gaetbulibacter aestuarii TaxID=1502358 RepID=A0ABW7MUU8_9FLAO
MRSFFKGYLKFFIGFGILSAIIMYIIYNTLNTYKPLPVYQPSNVSADLVDTTMQYQKKYHKIADFSLTNQNGKTITQDNYKNKIYVADFFFTTCQSICPVMTDQMVRVQNSILNDSQVMLLSHSVTPDIDTVAQLKRYAIEKGVNDKKWNLVTGDKKQIYDLARKSYLAVKDNPFAGKYDMIHTENFVLVDKKRQIRGFYDGTNPEEVDQLIKDIKHLEKEYTL